MVENLGKGVSCAAKPPEEITLEYVYREYSEEIMQEFAPSTKKRYNGEIPNIILPHFQGKQLAQIDLAFCKKVLKKIEVSGTRRSKGKRKYSNESMERFAFYIECMIKVASRHGFCENFLWDTDFRIKRKRIVGKKKADLKKELRRCLTMEELCKIAKLIFMDFKQTGQRMALLLMMVCGLRNNEACGVYFGDVEEILDHPGCYVLVIYKSTKGKGHDLKGGGKNRYVYRRIPIPKCLYDFIMLRKQYITEMVNDVNVNVNELPIACDGYNWRVACASPQITNAGRTIFSEINYSEDDFWLAEQMSGPNESGDKEHKAPSAYIFRRNFASMLYWFGFSVQEYQYLMGHTFLNKHAKREVYNNPDHQYALYRVLSQRPIKPPFVNVNNVIHYEGGSLHMKDERRATIIFDNPGHYLVKVVGNHPDDRLCITPTAQSEDGIYGNYMVSPSLADAPDEIGFLLEYIDEYISTWNRLFGNETKETGDCILSPWRD